MTEGICFAKLLVMLDNSDIKDKKEYELSFVLADETGVSEVDQVLARYGAEVSFRSPVTLIRLAYPIKKHESAYFGFVYFTVLPDAPAKIRGSLALAPKVLRSIMITPPMRQPVREPREARGIKREEAVIPAPAPKPETAVSNEALEKKLEEILK